MVDPELGLVIVFNGCIYNHHELRDELERGRLHFSSHSDTEVIVKAYHHWGERCVEHLIGMFAFAIVEHGVAGGGARPRPARDQAALSRRASTERCASPRRCRRCSPAAADRHRDRPGRAASLPELSRRRAGAADDPARRAQARAGDADDHRARRARSERALLVGPITSETPALRRGLGGADRSRHCERRSSAGWSPMCRSACCSPAASTRA